MFSGQACVLSAHHRFKMQSLSGAAHQPFDMMMQAELQKCGGKIALGQPGGNGLGWKDRGGRTAARIGWRCIRNPVEDTDVPLLGCCGMKVQPGGKHENGGR